jgi:predicted MPP superfamily phosphohydrolase
MLKWDLLFNGILFALDVAFILFFLHSSKKKVLLLVLLVLFGISAFTISVVVTAVSMLRPFATMRFLGMAVFWHLPLLLLIAGLCTSDVSSAERFLSKKQWFFAPIIVLLAVYFYAYYLEPKRLEITRYEFHDARLSKLRRPIVIAQVSDVQSDEVGDFENRVFAQLAQLRPDIILYTGDYLQCWDEASYLKQSTLLQATIRNADLNPPFGSFAVLGDSDIPYLWKRIFESLPVRILDDETITLNLNGVFIDIVALSPASSRASSALELRSAMSNAPADHLQVFVGHSPDYVMALQGMDHPFLALAGHTHGGQVQLPWIGPIFTLTRLPRKYGDYFGPFGSGILSVSRGIGMERMDAPRLRFLCRPEIRLITLR